MLTTLEGLDHAVIMVRDLDAAAQRWRNLGFIVSPRGTHSAHMGTGNYTIMFEDDYLELLGILAATDTNEPSRAFLERRGEGIERAAFRTRDAEGGVAALAARGIQALGPLHFSRPVPLPEGGSTQAAFSVFNWPVDRCPADLRIFACQHHTRAAVWVPSLTRHANTVRGITRLEVIAADPAASARQMAELIATVAQPIPEGACLKTAHGHADIWFTSQSSFARRHHLEPQSLPAEGAMALMLRVHDLDAMKHCVGEIARSVGDALVVPPDRSNGVTLIFHKEHS